MNQAEKDQLLVDVDAGLALLTSTKKPNPGTVNRAVQIFQGVKVACQTIPVTPVNEAGVPIETPPGGGENPPIEPAPPEIPPGGGGGGGTTEPPPVTTTTTTYTSSGDFSTSQGYRGWYYLEQDGTNMTYNPTNARWEGRQAFQSIWNLGQHPGATSGAMRRWTAQGTGPYVITGSVSDQSAGGSSGIRFQILKNGTAIYTNNMADGGSFTINETGDAAVGDTFDFLVLDPLGDIGKDGTLTSLSIALTTQNTSGTGGQTQTQLPFTLNGTPPQEGTLTVTMNKPANADTCTIPMTGVNLSATYGLLYFNGTSNSVNLWPSAPGNAGISATVNLQVPVAYVKNGQNTLRFTHTSGSGYTVTAVGTPVFTTIETPTPPATQTTLPFVLNGSILPEDGLLTVNLSKPANPVSTCTVSVTGTDLAEADGTLAVNGTANSMTIWPVNSANNGAVRTVNLTSVPSSWFNNGTNTLRFTHTTGDGFIVSAVSVAFTAQPDPEPPVGGAWPNQPSSHVLKTDWACSSPLPSGWADEYNGASLMSLVTSQNGPISPPSALQAFFPVGHPGGSGAGNFSYTYNPGTRSMYVGMWVKHDSPFQQHPDGDKICYYFANFGNLHPFYTLLNGSTVNLVWQNSPTAGTMDNRHLNGVNGSQFPFLGSGKLAGTVGNWTMGVWHRLEVYVRESTTPTSRDGIARWWVDGTPVGNYTNINTEQLGGFMGVHINPVYGGGLQVTKTQQDWVWYDHVRITGGS